MDKQLLKDEIEGMISKGKALREQEKLFIEKNSLDKQIELNRKNIDKLNIDFEKVKDSLAEKIDIKNNSLAEVVSRLKKKMNEILPKGNVVLDVSEGRFNITWEFDKKKRPYSGLSGSEKAVFDSALAHCFEADIIIVEAAELDSKNLESFLKKIAEIPEQVIVSTWNEVKKVPKKFNVINL